MVVVGSPAEFQMSVECHIEVAFTSVWAKAAGVCIFCVPFVAEVVLSIKAVAVVLAED